MGVQSSSIYRLAHGDGQTAHFSQRRMRDRIGGRLYDVGEFAGHMDAAMAGFTPEELEIATRFMTSMIDATVRAGLEAAQQAAPSPADPQ